MKWHEIDRENSKNAFEEYCNSKVIQCPQEYIELRNDICQIFAQVLEEIGITYKEISTKNYAYQVDCLFGLKFFMLLSDKYHMSIRTASSPGVWRYLSVYVVPDIVELRYGVNHPDRFWKKPKRLWLRVMWWYIYLSWQGTYEATLLTIKDNSTDEILQLVDRCGRGGYRVNLYRELMKKYSSIALSERRKSQLFRKVMVLNTARVQVVEPGLVDGGEKQYVQELYDYFHTI